MFNYNWTFDPNQSNESWQNLCNFKTLLPECNNEGRLNVVHNIWCVVWSTQFMDTSIDAGDSDNNCGTQDECWWYNSVLCPPLNSASTEHNQAIDRQQTQGACAKAIAHKTQVMIVMVMGLWRIFPFLENQWKHVTDEYCKSFIGACFC